MMTQVFAKQPAARIRSAQQALQVAEELAERFRSGAAQRDRQRELPHAELQHYFQSGLGAITVPRAWGGIEISSAELAQIFVMLSAADASIGQVPQNHFYALEVLRVNGSDAQQQRLYNEVLAGVHYGWRSSALRRRISAPPPSARPPAGCASTATNFTAPGRCLPTASRRWPSPMTAKNSWCLCRAISRA